MNTIPLARYRRSIASCLLCLVLLSGWFAYAPAIGGDFVLDDELNLDGLQHVEDTTSALEFVSSGSAGPVGRPLALASFLPQADAMDAGAASFLQVNILIHVVNAGLVACMLLLLSVARRLSEKNALVVTLCATSIWLFMPLLASTSLLIVQRMTSLSATFVLCGLIAYLLARRGLDDRPRQSLIGMSVAMAAGTILAVLTKENGALLPTLILILEATLLPRPVVRTKLVWRAWASVFLWAPTILLITYLAVQLPYDEATALKRGFTGWERLLTESRILWEYLFNAFVPRPGAFGPFHDSYPVARSIANPVTFLAFFGWLAMLIVAFTKRRRYPLFAFAVLWFLAGHLLESTTLPLELYFEHRNYLPILGPTYALCGLAVRAPSSIRATVLAGIVLYSMANAFVLFGQSTLWGNPPLAAHQWQQRSPDSVRATLRKMSYPSSEDWAQVSIASLRRFAEEHPQQAHVRILELDVSCLAFPGNDHRKTASSVKDALGSVEFTYNAITMLSGLYSTVRSTACNGVDGDTVRELAATLLRNLRYEQDTLYRQRHQQLLARLARGEGHFDSAADHIKKAMQYVPTAKLNMMMVTTLADAQKFVAARAFIREARSKAPRHPLKRIAWLSRLDGLERYVNEYERNVLTSQDAT